MKWLMLAVGMCASFSIPLWINQRQEYKIWMWTFFGLLPFLLYPLHLYMALRSWPVWPGYVQGLEIALLDLIAIGLFFSLPARRSYQRFTVPMILYGSTVLLSCIYSDLFESSIAYVLQLGRMFIVYSVVARASSDEQISNAILRGMTIGVIIEAVVVLYQRFGLGELQAAGTFPHQNSLGLASHFVAFPLFAIFIQQRKHWIGIPLAAVLACLIVEILTVSRATIGLAAIGFLVVFLVSAARNWTPRKATIAVAAFVGVLFLVPLVLASFSERNLSDDDGYDERGAFERAAASMLIDHPFGIGANHYVVAANSGGYNEAAGVVPTANSLGAHVHNVYYLVAAETGWLGLVAFLFVIGCPLIYAFRASYRLRRSRQGDLLLGLSVSLMIVYLHSMFEWTFITWSLQYFAAIAFGLIVGISTQQTRSTVPGDG